jgi:hypothetical protein
LSPERPRFSVGDEIAVYACGTCVAVRKIVRATARKAVDDRGEAWTMRGERWGHANRAVDADYIQPATDGHRAFLQAQPPDASRVALMRSRLRRVVWFSPGGNVVVPSDAAVLRVWGALMWDGEFALSFGVAP